MKTILSRWGTTALIVMLALLLPNKANGQNSRHCLPEISLSNPQGETIKLSSLRGKVVLVDFWASWCGPCRAENPNVARCYAKYKSKRSKKGDGFEVFSISLDVNKDRWQKAIKSDRMTWAWQGCDFRGWESPVAKRLGIKQIPSNFLIDKDGVVMASNLTGENLCEFLKGIFGE